jgi:hypothetical protein
MSDTNSTPEPEAPVQKVGPITLLFSSALSDEENAKLGGVQAPTQRRHGATASTGSTRPPKG